VTLTNSSHIKKARKMISQISGINSYPKNSLSFGALKGTKGAIKILMCEITDSLTAQKHLKEIRAASTKGFFDVILKKGKLHGEKNLIRAVFKLKDPYSGFKNPFSYYIPIKDFQIPVKPQGTSDIATTMLEHVAMSIGQGNKHII
jgi:hypothetical protein